MKNIEGNLEGFDQEKHRMLKDNKSWVLKETPERLWSNEDHYIYNELVDKAVSANAGLSRQEAYGKIKDLEKKYDFDFSSNTEYFAPHAPEALDRKKLYIFQELNLIDKEGKEKLDKISFDFERTAEEIAKATDEDIYETKRLIDKMLISNRVDDLTEAKEIMIDGTVVRGFENNGDELITNERVKSFISDAFTPNILREARIGKIIKDNKYLMNPGVNNRDKGNDLIGKGICKWTGGIFLQAENKEDYLQAEKILENVDDDNKLSHVYKIRARTNDFIFSPIKIESFEVEKMSDFDYLKDAEMSSEKDKERAYMLGTIVHEIAHKIDSKLESDDKNEYKKIIEQESMRSREKYVSDYVVINKEKYQSSDYILIREDFAEAIRIYATNPAYLENNYPKRFNFIKGKMPYIKQGSVIEFLKQK